MTTHATAREYLARATEAAAMHFPDRDLHDKNGPAACLAAIEFCRVLAYSGNADLQRMTLKPGFRKWVEREFKRAKDVNDFRSILNNLDIRD